MPWPGENAVPQGFEGSLNHQGAKRPKDREGQIIYWRLGGTTKRSVEEGTETELPQRTEGEASGEIGGPLAQKTVRNKKATEVSQARRGNGEERKKRPKGLKGPVSSGGHRRRGRLRVKSCQNPSRIVEEGWWKY